MPELIYDSFTSIETPELENILKLINIQPNNTFCDLGSGDGTVVLAAERAGARATGIEYDTELYTLSIQNLQSSGSSATIQQADFYTTDFSQYDIIFANLSDDVYRLLWDKFLQAKTHGARIFLYIGVEGYSRCRTCYPPITGSSVYTFDTTVEPWYVPLPQYYQARNPNKPFTHTVVEV